MSNSQPGIAQIKADLAARIMTIDARVAHGRAGDIAREMDAIRQIAHRGGLYPAAMVAHALESALGRGECGALIRGWLVILSDAVGSERHDPAACDVYAAACSVRLSG